ncbi:MAG: type IV secretion system protein [Pseudomonadota bacterium]
MKKLRRIVAFFIIAVMSVILPVQTVMAAFEDLACDAAGGATGGVFDPKIIYDTAAQGPIDPSNPCGLVSVDNIFSSIGCRYVSILNDVFSKFFCALQFGMRDLVVAVVALYIAIYGVRLLIGTQEATGGAAILAFIKIGIVYMFIDKGALAVGYIYKFFVSFIQESVAWVFSGINCPTIICIGRAQSISEVFGDIDEKVKFIIMGTNDGTTAGLFTGNGELILFFFVLFFISFTAFMLLFTMIAKAVSVFVSSLVTFMLSITAVAFLISLSPIFMSFMLFNSTYSLFDNWLRFLVSYSLQPMIIFAIFSLWIIISFDFLNFIGDIGKVITVLPKASTDKVGVLTVEDKLVFCPLFFPPDKKPGFDSISLPSDYTLGGPGIQCCGKIVPIAPDGQGPIFMGCDTSKEIQDNPNLTADDYLKDNDLKVYLREPQAVLRDERFVYYLGYHFIALLAIASAFFQLLKMTPQIAQALSRSQATMPLGRGFGGGEGLSSMISKATDGVRKTAGKTANSVSQKIEKMSTQR